MLWVVSIPRWFHRPARPEPVPVRRRKIVDLAAVKSIPNANLDFIEPIENVEFRQPRPSMPHVRTVCRTSTASNHPQRAVEVSSFCPPTWPANNGIRDWVGTDGSGRLDHRPDWPARSFWGLRYGSRNAPNDHGPRSPSSAFQPLAVAPFLPLFFTYSGLNTKITLLYAGLNPDFRLGADGGHCPGKASACGLAARATAILPRPGRHRAYECPWLTQRRPSLTSAWPAALSVKSYL